MAPADKWDAYKAKRDFAITSEGTIPPKQYGAGKVTV